MDRYAAIEAAAFFTRMGHNQAAAIHSMAALVTMGNPWLSQAFKANAETSRLIAHQETDLSFGINETTLHDVTYQVAEENRLNMTHGTLKHFRKIDGPEDQPKVLLLSPLSGHPGRLIRSEAIEMVPDHDLSTLEWHDPADVPLTHGSLDLNGYIDAIIQSLEELGPKSHVIAICQPCVPLMAALSYMESINHPDLPLSVTMKGGPVDTRYNPTGANKAPQELAKAHGVDGALEILRESLVMNVSDGYVGAGQPVHHRYNQLSGFYALAPESHALAYAQNWARIAWGGDPDKVDRHTVFYKGYNHVRNIPGEYLMDTNRVTFLDAAIPTGRFIYRPNGGNVHHIVDADNIQNVDVFVVEGITDTITGLGQTAAALDITGNLRSDMKHMSLEDTGHYGVFAGRVYRDSIAPKQRGIIRFAAERHGVPAYAPTDREVDMPERFQRDSHPAFTEPAFEAVA